MFGALRAPGGPLCDRTEGRNGYVILVSSHIAVQGLPPGDCRRRTCRRRINDRRTTDRRTALETPEACLHAWATGLATLAGSQVAPRAQAASRNDDRFTRPPPLLRQRRAGLERGRILRLSQGAGQPAVSRSRHGECYRAGPSERHRARRRRPVDGPRPTAAGHRSRYRGILRRMRRRSHCREMGGLAMICEKSSSAGFSTMLRPVGTTTEGTMSTADRRPSSHRSPKRRLA